MQDSMDFLARAGYVARSLIYFALGGFALMALIPGGTGGETGASKEALSQIQSIPFGGTLLLATGAGLILFAVWRLIQAFFDVDHHGDDKKGIAIRTGLFVSAVTHGSLAFFAISISSVIGGSGGGSGGSGSSKQAWASWLMEFPGGEYLLMALGLVIVAYGISQFVKAYREGFAKYMDIEQKTWACTVSKIGLSARGFSFLIVAVFVIYAGWSANAEQVSGTEAVWTFLSGKPFGQTLMVLMALGFICFGIYNLLEARYRRISMA